jgi:uncharacterized membrane protein YdjX (TVP38/TMEM64 family)
MRRLTQRERRIAGWGAVVVGATALVVVMLHLPLPELLAGLRAPLRKWGLWGVIAFGAIYVVATLLLLPGYPMTIGAGLTFSLLPGIAVVSLASTLSACIALLVGRAATRSRVQRLALRHPRLQTLDAAIGRSGWRLVALMRLAPSIPFGLLNYLFGATSVRFWPYTLATWACMLPKTIMYVYIGHLAQLAATSGNDAVTAGSRLAWAARILGLVASIALALYATHLARRAAPRYVDMGDMKDFLRQQSAAPGFRSWRLWLALVIAFGLWGWALCVALDPGSLRQPVLRLCATLSSLG